MADWSGILKELQENGGDFDGVRRKYLKRLHNHTKRNVITYYSGWLQKPGAPNLIINDLDKNAFMATMKGLDRSTGLDLMLHTPGGDVAATESIIDYLVTMFEDIRVIVPQLAMSGGTMIACSANRILMGKHSSLGPIDPQFFIPSYGQVAAHGVLEEFEKAYQEIKRDQAKVFVWQPIISKYTPTLIGECQKAMDWAETIARERLAARMLVGVVNDERAQRIDEIIKNLINLSVSLSHARHLSYAKCKEVGLVVERLEDDQTLQENVLSVHHAMMHTLERTFATKIVENHMDVAYIQQAPVPNRQER